MEAIIKHVAEVEKEIVEKDATIEQLRRALEAEKDKVHALEAHEKELETELSAARCESERLANERDVFRTQSTRLQEELLAQRVQADAARERFDETTAELEREREEVAKRYDELSGRFEALLDELSLHPPIARDNQSQDQGE